MNNLPNELMLKTILKLGYKDIKKLCKTNKSYSQFCKENKNYIFKKLIERDFVCLDSSSYEELYVYMLNPSKTRLDLCKKKYCDKSQDIMQIIRLYITITNQEANVTLRTRYVIDLYDIVTSCKLELISIRLLQIFLGKITEIDYSISSDNEYYDEWKSKIDIWITKLTDELVDKQVFRKKLTPEDEKDEQYEEDEQDD
jgi:hypothetical protein